MHKRIERIAAAYAELGNALDDLYSTFVIENPITAAISTNSKILPYGNFKTDPLPTTLDELKRLATKKVEAGKKDAVKGILNDFGVERISLIDLVDYDKVYKRLEEL